MMNVHQNVWETNVKDHLY